MMRHFLRTICIASSLAAGAYGMETNELRTIIVPREMETELGPAWADLLTILDQRTQQIYGAPMFNELPVDVIEIREIAFRVDQAATNFDVTYDHLQIRMNIYAGSLGDAYTNGNADGVGSTVFEADNVHLSGRAGVVDAFDVRFPFKTPFVYDRRRGQLVITAYPSHSYIGRPASMDATGTAGYGFIWYIGGSSTPALNQFPSNNYDPVTVTTKFTYVIAQPIIESVAIVNNELEIIFSYPSAKPVHVESATSPEGPYSVLENLDVVSTKPGEARATVPIEKAATFFRIRGG